MTHFERLTSVYAKAPIHNFYEGISILIEDGKSTISLPIDTRYFHGGMAVHGSVYFKLLDDAAYFACQSKIHDFFILTTNFSISLRRPITGGKLTAIGEFIESKDDVFFASSTLLDENGKVCALGQGEFKKSKTGLKTLRDY